jgi:hypothetical protein
VKLVVAVPPVNTVPPDDSAYQSMVSPVAGVADINTVPVPQRELLPAAGAAGNAFTVISEVVLLQPDEVWENVKVAFPAVKPVTSPAFVTEATSGLFDTHVPPVIGDRFVVPFTQIDVLPVMPTTGKGITTIVLSELQGETHPAASFLFSRTRIPKFPGVRGGVGNPETHAL